MDIIIKTPQGVALTLRDIEPYKDFWHIPGGTVYYGETIEAAAQRVAREELGVEVAVGAVAGFVEYPREQKLRGWGWTISLEVYCSVRSGKPSTDKQARGIRFFKQYRDLPPNVVIEQKKFLEKILK